MAEPFSNITSSFFTFINIYISINISCTTQTTASPSISSHYTPPLHVKNQYLISPVQPQTTAHPTNNKSPSSLLQQRSTSPSTRCRIALSTTRIPAAQNPRQTGYHTPFALSPVHDDHHPRRIRPLAAQRPFRKNGIHLQYAFNLDPWSSTSCFGGWITARNR